MEFQSESASNYTPGIKSIAKEKRDVYLSHRNQQAETYERDKEELTTDEVNTAVNLAT